jgi:hypothetical protein
LSILIFNTPLRGFSMSSIRSNFSVALSGEKWSVGNVALWQSTDDNVILFTPNQPTLARNRDNNRYQAAVSQYRVQREGAYRTVGGAALMTIDTGITYDAQVFNQIKEQWREEVVGSGRARTRNPRFVPLTTRNATAELLIPEAAGTPSQATLANKDFGTIGSPVSLLANLTAEGAQEWVQGVQGSKNIVAGVMIRYEHLRAIPASSVRIRVNGSRVFRHLSAHLKADVRNFWYGGSLDLQGQWESMVRNGAIDVQIMGLDALPSSMEDLRQKIISTFIDQAFQNFFPMLFEAKPDVKPAEPGDRRGLFGGTNFALKWRRESDASNLSLNMDFTGYTWLKSSMDADVTTLLAGLDGSYVNEVNTELTFPALLNVSADPMVNTVSVSCSAREGNRPVMIPATAAFNEIGGTAQYLVTSRTPNSVDLSYRAKIDFKNPRFPVIEESRTQKAGDDGTMVIKPSKYLGSVKIYMYVLDDAGHIDMMNIQGTDQLVVNLSVGGSHLATPIRESARVSPFPFGEEIEFTYPVPQNGSAPQISFSAFGVIGGRLVRAPQQTVQLEEDAIFIVVRGTTVQLISREAQLLESDAFSQRLLEAGTSPVISMTTSARDDDDPEPVEELVAVDLSSSTDGQPTNGHPGTSNGRAYVSGTLTGVEYSKYGPAIWVEVSGDRRRIPAHSIAQVEHFDDEGPKLIKVALDGQGYADSILVELS